MASPPVISVIHPIIHQAIPTIADIRARADERAGRTLDAAASLARWRVNVDHDIDSLRCARAARPWPQLVRPDPGALPAQLQPIDLLRALLASEADVSGEIIPSPNGLAREVSEHWSSVVDSAPEGNDPHLDPTWARRWALADLECERPAVDIRYLVGSLGCEVLSLLAPLSKLMDQDFASEREVVRRCVENAKKVSRDRVFEPVQPAYLDRHGGVVALDRAFERHHGVLIVGYEGTGRTALLEAWVRRLKFSSMPSMLSNATVWQNPFDERWLEDELQLERVIAGQATLLTLTPKGRRVYYDSREEQVFQQDDATPDRLWGYEPEYAAGALESALIERCAEWAAEPWKQVFMAIVVTPSERERLVARVPLVGEFPAVDVPALAPQDHLPIWLCHTMDRPKLGIEQALAIMSDVRPADVARMSPWDVEPVLGSALAQRLWDPDKLQELRPADWLERALTRIRQGRDPWQREMLGAKGRFVDRFIGDDQRFSALVRLPDILYGSEHGLGGDAARSDDREGRGTVPPSVQPTITNLVPPRSEDLPNNVHFVFRNQHEGLLSKRVCRISGTTVLEWFQMAWHEAAKSEDPDAWVAERFGGFVPGLASLFQDVMDEGLDPPETCNELYELLQDHLYVSGGSDDIRQSSRALRVKTQHDDIEMAYYLFDAAYAEAHPDRCAYLLSDAWPLPMDTSDGEFEPEVRPAPLLPAGQGQGATYACLLTNYHNGSLRDLRARVFPGVRLPELADFLRHVEPLAEEMRGQGNFCWFETWPLELRLLRAMVEPRDVDIEPALHRCNRYPVSYVATHVRHTRVGIGPHERAREAFVDAASEARHIKRDIDRTQIVVGEHIAQMSLWADKTYGFQQWFIFDDRWASAHPDLACSLLRYASGWDPLI